MISLTVAFVCLFALCNGQKSVSIMSCSDNPISEVVVDPCGSEPCSFARGTNPVLRARTKSNQDSDKLRLSVKAKIVGRDIKFPGLKEDACAGKGITCPVKKGDDINFEFEVKVLPFYPTIGTNVTVQVQGTAGPLFCFVIPVQIV